MKKIEVKEMQQIELNILLEIDKFCKKNKIMYFLGCGTLFSASVMQKFFPWDDDIDIIMPRKDYESFVDKFKVEGLKLLSCNNKDYYYPYAKVVDTRTTAQECKNVIKDYGVFVDVFPIDGVPNQLYLLLLKPIKYLMYSQWGCYLKGRKLLTKIIYKTISIILFPFPKNFFARVVDNICKRHSLDKCKKAGIVCHYKHNKDLVCSSYFKKRSTLEFERHTFFVPKMYKKYLKELYGDYEERNHRVGHKYLKAYWKD